MKHNAGSSLLTCIMLVTMITLCSMIGMRSTWFYTQCAFEHASYEQLFWASQGLLDYGIFICLCQKLTAVETSWNIPWPVGAVSGQGVLVITTMATGYGVTACVKRLDTCEYVKLSCSLLRCYDSEKTYYRVEQWRRVV
jgi:hypothetical protein